MNFHFRSWIVLLILIGVPVARASDPIGQLSVQAAEVIKLADHCLPKVEGKETVFCTGFKFSESQLRQLTDSSANCQSEIAKSGFAVVMDNSAGKVPAEDWAAFINSTQMALTFHENKIVAFKKGTGPFDCLHELIHVYQQTRGAGKLSPKNRAEVAEGIRRYLEQRILEVEGLEKRGQQAEAKKIAADLASAMTQLKELSSLSDGLDEVEAYYFLYRQCKLLKCGDEINETNIANLSLRAPLLPVDVRDQVLRDSADIIGRKKRTAIEKAKRDWKPLSENKIQEFTSLMSKSWKDILAQAKLQNLRALLIEGAYTSELGMEQVIPAEMFSSLPRPSKQELGAIKDSKIVNGRAVGKFVCVNGAFEKPALLLTKQATRGTAVHEFIHFIQSQLNPGYCDALFGQKAVDEAFKFGKISRTEHDQKLLYMQAINALAEREVYSLLLKSQEHFGKVENLNNGLMLKSYDEWLSEKVN